MNDDAAAEPERGASGPEPDTAPAQPDTEPERNAAQERDTVLVPRDEDLEHSDRQMWAFKQLIELERQRVDSNNRRTDVAVKAIAASDASDKRQYEYHVEKLRRGSEERKARHGSAIKFVWAVFALAVVSGAFVVGMLFFGDGVVRSIEQANEAINRYEQEAAAQDRPGGKDRKPVRTGRWHA